MGSILVAIECAISHVVLFLAKPCLIGEQPLTFITRGSCDYHVIGNDEL